MGGFLRRKPGSDALTVGTPDDVLDFTAIRFRGFLDFVFADDWSSHTSLLAGYLRANKRQKFDRLGPYRVVYDVFRGFSPREGLKKWGVNGERLGALPSNEIFAKLG